MTNNSLNEIYKEHHAKNRPYNFSILELERAKLLERFIGKNKRILDIGCRDGVLTKHFAEGNKIIGADIDDGALMHARENLGIQTVQMDLNGDWNELQNEKFDVVVAGEVLEHLYNPDQIIQKVANHLKNNGMFVGSVPNAFSLKNRLRYLFGTKKYTPLSDPTHINHFSYSELKSLLEKVFVSVDVVGMGRYKFLSKIFPGLISFDLFFVAKDLIVFKRK